MKTEHLIFIGIKGSVVALNRATGQQVWVTHLKGSDFVNVLLEDGAVLASCCGEIFSLDPLTGFYRDGCCSTGPEHAGSVTRTT